MTRFVLANQATATKRRVYFDLRNATDGITAETAEAGGQPQISTNGGPWTATGIGILTAIGSGRYYADLTQAAVLTAGTVIETRYKSAATAESPGDSVQVVAIDLDDAVRGGFASLPDAAPGAAGGLPISLAGALDLDARLDAAMSSRQPAGAVDLNPGQTGVTIGTVNALGAQAQADVNAEVDAALDTAIGASPTVGSFGERLKALDDAYTAARAALLDNLNVGGPVASSTEATSIQNNTRAVRGVPNDIQRPASGSITRVIELYLYDTAGNMEAPDAAPTLGVVNQAGVDRSANLDVTTMTLVSTGHYKAVYTIASTHSLEQLRFEFTVVELGKTRQYGNTIEVVDTKAVDFTTADRTKLDTLHDTRLTSARATNLDKLDAAVSTRSAPATAQALDLAQGLPASPTADTVGAALKDADTQLDAAVSSRSVFDPATDTVTNVATVATLAGNTPQTGDNFARLGAPAGASISADVAAVKAETALIVDDTGGSGVVIAGTPAVNMAQINGDAAAAQRLAAGAKGILEIVIAAGSTTTAVVISTINGATPSTQNDFYKDVLLVFATGALKNQRTEVTAYDGATKTLTVTAMTSAPAVDDMATIL